MFNRIKSIFLDLDGSGIASAAHHRHRHDVDELQVAAAALLVEAACLDEDFDDAERARIGPLVQDRFGLNAEETKTLIETAEREVEDANQILHFTRAIKDGFDHDERIAMIEMLWEVAYADGKLHDYEANLLRRIGGLIYVSDHDIGAARKRVLARIEASGKADSG
ncbi:MAG: TerB family tellurite resistance protein [Alphaproteobacteria bacterium]